MASPLISNPVTNTDRSRDSSKRKKKKKSQSKQGQHDQNKTNWKSQTQQETYSSKLLQALSQVRVSSSAPASNEPRRGRAVREAADRILAMAAKGRTRWSRAILTSRLKLKFRKPHKRQRVAATANNRSKKPRVSVLRLKGKTLPAIQRKTKALGRLVPGCRKQPLPVILEEATDYIPALEMEVKVMSALFNFLSGSTSGAAGPSSAPVPPSE